MELNGRQKFWLTVLGLILVSAVLASLDSRALRDQRQPVWDGSIPASP